MRGQCLCIWCAFEEVSVQSCWDRLMSPGEPGFLSPVMFFFISPRQLLYITQWGNFPTYCENSCLLYCMMFYSTVHNMHIWFMLCFWTVQVVLYEDWSKTSPVHDDLLRHDSSAAVIFKLLSGSPGLATWTELYALEFCYATQSCAKSTQ